ncbi:hypothetical protein ACFSMW_18555 [Virgibacillus halophilus]|uniref:Uncharacterized protein n=1 Tax=Tigheibacillus halophilus TaxID=361280 RepID=A0ABU5C897_9BACI|nr:hypothetical protein [Virgibacillus halophilus]
MTGLKNPPLELTSSENARRLNAFISFSTKRNINISFHLKNLEAKQHMCKENTGMTIATPWSRPSLQYNRLTAKITSFLREGKKGLIENGWMEQTPIAADCDLSVR